MQDHFANRVTKPENCILAFGIPTSIEDFKRDLELANKDFAKDFNGVSARYDKEFLQHLEKTECKMVQSGARILRRLTLDDFGALFVVENVDVIILFTHWTKKNEIEFFDGLAAIPQVIEKIPADFVGLLDLCVCHPRNLSVGLRKEHPDCLTRFTDNKATPFLWLYFYHTLFKYLASNDINYMDALKDVIKTFLSTTKIKTGNDK